jgi:hypothetical protein
MVAAQPLEHATTRKKPEKTSAVRQGGFTTLRFAEWARETFNLQSREKLLGTTDGIIQ